MHQKGDQNILLSGFAQQKVPSMHQNEPQKHMYKRHTSLICTFGVYILFF